MTTINSEETLAETWAKRLAHLLVLMLIVGVEAAWVGAIVAGAIWLLFLR